MDMIVIDYVTRSQLIVSHPDTYTLIWKITFNAFKVVGLIIRINDGMYDKQRFGVIRENGLEYILPIRRSDRDAKFYWNFRTSVVAVTYFQNPGFGETFGWTLFEQL